MQSARAVSLWRFAWRRYPRRISRSPQSSPFASFSAPSLPTPLRRLAELSHEGADVWLKDDGLTHPVYGGNKVRKVDALVREAVRRGARRIVTFGAAGSHHVLTTALFARAAGLEVRAVLTPQPHGEHAAETLRASLGAGVEAIAAPSALRLPWAVARALAPGDAVIPPGGSNAVGAAAYVAAWRELTGALRELGEAPPDVVVVPLGTGGTAAGLLAGAALEGAPTVIAGVSVLNHPVARPLVMGLASAVLRRHGAEVVRRSARTLDAVRRHGPSLRVERDYAGGGYGVATEAGRAATERLRALGLQLDPAYTAKAMAFTLELVERLRVAHGSRRLRIVYLHTLSRVPFEPLLAAAPAWDDVPRELRALLR